MSLNKTLDRLFDEIRREAKRNPEFADRLDAVLRTHASRREATETEFEDSVADIAAAAAMVAAPAPVPDMESPQALNPAGFYKREGEAALVEVLAGLDEDALQALIEEHNLDPSGAADGLDREGVTAHILAQAKRRAERDERMFDY